MPRKELHVPGWQRPIRIPPRVPLTHASPSYAVAGQTGTWRLPFRLSKSVRGGAELRLQLLGGRNNRAGLVDPQVDRPGENGYLTARTKKGSPIEIMPDAAKGTFILKVPAKGLSKGELLTVTAGDTSEGGGGIVACNARILNKFFVLYQPQKNINLSVWAGPSQDLMLAACTMHILGGPIHHIHAWAPSVVRPGESLTILVRPEDEFHNLSSQPLGKAALLRGRRKLKAKTEPVADSTCLRLTTKAGRAGVLRLTVRHPASGLEALTNPILCRADAPAQKPFWGMIHGHTEMSDGTGTLDHYFHQLRDEAALDFAAPGDHDHLWETSGEMWKVTCGKVKEWHEDGRFVVFLGYEWAKWRKNGDGDRNVYYLEDDRPFYRSDEGERPTPPDLFRALRDEEAVIIPHHTGHIGNFCDWKDHDAVRERLVEIYQVRGSYECSEADGNPAPEHVGTEPYVDGYVRRALAMGWRVGFTAGGDDHGGSAGTGKSKDGLMCAFASDLTRQALWDALWNRRVVATTGARMLLWYELDGKPMGSELDAQQMPELRERRRLRVSLHCASPVRQVDIIRNNEVVHTEHPGSEDSELAWEDKAPLDDVLLPPVRFCDHPFCFYYVRVVQEDGEVAWASPVWIDAKA